MKNFNKKSILIALTALLAIGMAGLVIAAAFVNLNTADDFAVLGGAGITNTGATTITGNVGTYPTTSETGFGSVTLNGSDHVGDAVTQQAKNDLVTAYNAAGQAATTVPTELGGTTKTAGVYDSAAGTFGITGTLTLDGQGDPNAVFIFRTASTLITADASHVSLVNSAQACNVFWQVGSSATLGIDSFFKGNLMALVSATLTTGANVNGRILARNGAVTLDSNTITRATCAAPAPATLHVIKTVVNDSGGTANASAFNLHVKLSGVDVSGSPAAGATAPGTSYSLAAGTYVVSENTNDSYVQGISGDCDAGGNITLAAGENKTCTITNNDITPPVINIYLAIFFTVVNTGQSDMAGC